MRRSVSRYLEFVVQALIRLTIPREKMHAL